MIAFARIVASLVTGGVLLSGCTGEIMQSHVDRSGADAYFQYGAAPGEMLAVVVGNPFPVAKPIVDQAVVDAMQRAHNGPMTHFSTQPGPAAHRDYRIVMAFNTPVAFHPRQLCGASSAIPSAAEVEKVQILAGFCVGDELFSRAKITAPEITSPHDPRFAHMVKSAMWALIPARDPYDDEQGPDILQP